MALGEFFRFRRSCGIAGNDAVKCRLLLFGQTAARTTLDGLERAKGGELGFFFCGG